MSIFKLNPISAGTTAWVFCLGFAASAHAQIFVRPPVLVAPQIIVPQVVIPQPYVVVAPQAAYVAPGPVVGYVATPLDAFIVNAAPADVVFINGDTYIWAVDEHGHRYRRFYGHGDRRADLNHRRDELHRVMERNGGHLPGREGNHGEAHAAMEHNTAVAHAEQARAAAAPQAHAAAAHPAPEKKK
jgi:hypothetical protein